MSLAGRQLRPYLAGNYDPAGRARWPYAEQSRGTAVSEEDKSFIAEFYKYSFVGVMLDWIRQGMTADPRVLTEKISAAMRGSIANAIRNFSETE